MISLVIVHIDDVNLADAKALAARHGATIIGSRHIPRGHVYVTNHAATNLETPERP